MAVVAALASLPLMAAPVQAADNGAFSLRLGGQGAYQRAELAWESPTLWARKFDGGSRLALVGELGVAYWNASGSRSPDSMTQLSAIPFLRWSVGERFYLEAGVGPTFLSRTRFADKKLSTSLQFGDHLGVGAYVTDNSRVGLRVSHFSNASIKRPNAGLNIVQLLYSYEY